MVYKHREKTSMMGAKKERKSGKTGKARDSGLPSHGKECGVCFKRNCKSTIKCVLPNLNESRTEFPWRDFS